ncbi:MFP transporter [Chitiniphilus shinanonensis]|uniref:MFP transporter n=1 Tax=Chitiniphilus shinanonensis TaxID=553088 RepID=A0ABQ6BUN0_9NEIS|nr:biotin/lipoyl-binding protein [Chitiniphilus shinanonensis]GLS05451.1 MFP transporter [Chitiniphilus shinanonensis]
MDALLLGIYAFFVWLIFFKFKWLPWNKVSMVIVFTIPVVALTILILTLNVVAPSSSDVRVMNKVLQVVPQVRGRVVEIAAEGNRDYKKGDVLLRIDPTPYQSTVKQLKARLKADDAALADAEASARQLNESIRAAAGKVSVAQAKLDLARRRLAEHEELVAAGAGDKFALEDARTRVRELEGELVTAEASENEAKQKLSAKSQGEFAAIASARARRGETETQLENAQWELDQTIYRAPADGRVINLQVRVGTMLVPMPFAPAFSFVEDEQELVAFYQQNELYNVADGNEAEVALLTHPGEIIKARVDSIVWAQSQGQVQPGGMLPNTGPVGTPPNRFAVKLKLDGKYKNLVLPAGALGAGAIYTEHGQMVHILRKVFLRVSTKLNYLVLKLH